MSTASSERSDDLSRGAILDIDGDGKASPWEVHLCKMCLVGAIAIAFGDRLL